MKISWITRWPGRSAGWALPAKTTWTGRSASHSSRASRSMSLNSSEARLYVANRRAKPIVRIVRVERRLELVEHGRRLAVTGELVAQPPAGEDRQLELLALVGPPQLRVGDARHALPEAAPFGLRIEVVEVRFEVAPVERGHRRADPASANGRRS